MEWTRTESRHIENLSFGLVRKHRVAWRLRKGRESQYKIFTLRGYVEEWRWNGGAIEVRLTKR